MNRLPDAKAYSIDERVVYPELSLVELADRIVHLDDQGALNEILDCRTLFKFGESPPMLFPEFLEEIRTKPWVLKWIDHNQFVLDKAYDITVDKFSHIPRESHTSGGKRPKRPDCRHYFKAFLKLTSRWLATNPDVNPVLEEIVAARVLQNLVVRHFRLSCKEALRNSNPLMSRYAWQVNGSVIHVLMPISMPGRDRGKWLKTHVNDPDPKRSGEKQRIQSIINDRLGKNRHVTLTKKITRGVLDRSAGTPLDTNIEGERNVHGMAHVVAEEKAECIQNQRPAIRTMGKASLKKLIHHVFEALSTDQYEEKRIAGLFGLSRPTFSRFAGSRWENETSSNPPDLWRNVAQTLAAHGPFIEVAKETGVWRTVHNIVKSRSE